MIFSVKPCLPYFEKARIEFLLQRLAECIGVEAMKLPVLIPEETFARNGQALPLEQILQLIGQHLNHDTSAIRIRIAPQILNTCGGGG